MNMRAAVMLCLLVLGCTDRPIELAADSGSAPLSRRNVVAPPPVTSEWVVRRMKTRVAALSVPKRDAGAKGDIIHVPRVDPDGGIIRPEQDDDAPVVPRDAGQPLQPDEEDAGSEPPAPCDSPSCLCGDICERGLALECPEEDSLDACVEQCSVVIPDCYEQQLRLLRCSVALTNAAYSCDPDIEVFVVEGCYDETEALDTCLQF